MISLEVGAYSHVFLQIGVPYYKLIMKWLNSLKMGCFFLRNSWVFPDCFPYETGHFTGVFHMHQPPSRRLPFRGEANEGRSAHRAVLGTARAFGLRKGTWGEAPWCHTSYMLWDMGGFPI